MALFKVQAAEAGQRADVFVADKYPEFSRSALSRLFDEGLVRIDEVTAKASQKLKPGDQVRVEEGPLRREPEPIEIPVVYENDQVVVMDKPAGVLTHSKGALNTEATVASFLKPRITDAYLSGNRAGIVHRLDRGTSGVIIAAKTEPALRHLQKQFSNRKTKKTYLAVVEGWPVPAEAVIDAPIQRNPRRPQTFRVNATGKPAQTYYKVLRELKKTSQRYALLELKPVTGRTHQLRVHLAYIGHPIVGDSVYGHGPGPILLHAQSLELTLPDSERKVFQSPTPSVIKEFIKL